jgi:hypothetical protein
MTVKVTKPQVNVRELANKTNNLEQYIGTEEVNSQKVSVQNELNIPAGDSSSRPTNIPTGSTRWNTESNTLEVYNGSEWLSIAIDYVPAGSTNFGG